MKIYIEEALITDKKYKDRIDRIRDSVGAANSIIPIRHYKDVFNRPRQSRAFQRKDRAIILAKKTGNLIYPGAPVCQDFGNKHFYYTSLVMNCPFDCEYCYLKGMYPSGYTVIFLNIEDIFSETEALLKEHPVYLCVSYDTDLPAIEALTGYVKLWEDFVSGHKDLTIEVRTKSAGTWLYNSGNGKERIIFAFTLSPNEIIKAYEHGTPSLSDRLCAAEAAMNAGYSVRLCFDPLIFVPGFEEVYGGMIREVKEKIDLSRVRDISVGTFRVSADYLKAMRRQKKDSKILSFPFQTIQGICGYPKNIDDKMTTFLTDKLSDSVENDKVFLPKYNIETETPKDQIV